MASRSSRIAQVTAHLRAAAAWFLIGRDGDEAVAMALVHPFRASGGTGDVIPGTLFLNLIYVLPDRWGQGIGGTMLDAVIAEGARRGCHRIYLWTHEHQNERASAVPKPQICSDGPHRARRRRHAGWRVAV